MKRVALQGQSRAGIYLSVDTGLGTPIPIPAFAHKQINDSVSLDNYDFKSF